MNTGTEGRASAFRRFPTALAVATLSLGLVVDSARCEAPGPNLADSQTVPASEDVNAVARWNAIATETINSTVPSLAVTPEEQRPIWVIDLATVHLAIYDAAIAIARTHEPFAVLPTVPAAGASVDAAVSAAAYGVLRGLFPNRSNHYQATYESMLAALPEGVAKARGLALGAEVAAGILALRANDGRNVTLPPYVPGTEPGEFRGIGPGTRIVPFIRPFTLTGAAQFRSPGPPALGSEAYAIAFEEVRTLGGTASTQRTPQQTEAARFHAETPTTYWARNLRQFAKSQSTVAENARLSALIWVSLADSAIGCFESKYHYDFWRPASAVPLADTDGNAATQADPTWTPLGPVPDHPEHPAAHACTSAALQETLSGYFGAGDLSFAFDSTLSGTTHSFASLGAMAEETQLARIWGGMHFRSALVDGAELGARTSRWVASRHFRPRR